MRPYLLAPALLFAAGCAAGRGSVGASGEVVHARVALLGDGPMQKARSSFIEASVIGPARPTQADPVVVLVDPAGARAASPGFISASAARCPAEMALVDAKVCVDRWEASLVVLDGGVERALSPYENVDHTSRFRAVSRPAVVPQGYISGAQAERACHASGKRLCTITEWERGCRGPAGKRYPYGNTRAEGVCNDDPRAQHPVVEAANKMKIPGDQMWSTGMQLPLINQLPDSLLPTGDRAGCVSDDGLFDMVGNLHEWVADADGTFRGGFYMDTSQNGEGCSYRTSAHDFDYHDYSTGFRCCADPDSIE